MSATERAVLIRYQREGTQRWGSGLRIGGTRVLTADHCANGQGHQVLVAGRAYDAKVQVRSHDPEVDLAVLNVPGLDPFPPLRLARVNRKEGRQIRCQALGFPEWKTGRSAQQVCAQVDGYVPTAEGEDPGRFERVAPLSLVITDRQIQARRVLRGDLDQEGSPWAGMSGSVVVAEGDLIIGVVRGHSPGEGTACLTLTPVDSVERLEEEVRDEFWRALEVGRPDRLPLVPAEVQAPPALPRRDSTGRNTSALADSKGKFLGRPSECEPFVGRHEELARLEELFLRYERERKTFACFIWGRSGIGKTCLADRLAIQKSGRVGGKVIRLDLHGETAGEGIKYLARYGTVSRRVEISEQAQEILDQIPPHSILIIDNVGRFQSHEIFGGSRRDLFIVFVSEVQPTAAVAGAFPGRCEFVELRELHPDECETLFRKVLYPEIVSRFDKAGEQTSSLLTSPVQRTPLFVRQICTVIEQIYLERKIHDVPDIVRQTREEVGRESLAFIFEKASELPAARQLILACSLFTSGKIPWEQAREVAGLAGADADAALDRLRTLGWLSGPDVEADPPWLSIHAIYQGYARREFCLLPSEEQGRLKQAFVAAWLKVLSGSHDVHDLWGVHGDVAAAVRYIQVLGRPGWALKGFEGLDAEQVLALEKVIPPKERIDFYWALLTAQHDRGKIARILGALAESLLRAGNTAVAQAFGLQSLKQYERDGDRSSAAAIRRCLGTIHRTEGDFRGSAEWFGAALETYRELGDEFGCAEVHRQIAQTLLESGDTPGALASLCDSQAILKELIDQGDHRDVVRTSLAYTYSSLADAYLRMDEVVKADHSIQCAIEIHEAEVGASHYFTGYDLRHLAKVKIRQGDFAEARRLLETSARINFEFFGPSPSSVVIDLNRAEAELAAGDPEAAGRLVEKVLAVLGESTQKESKFTAYALRVKAEADVMKGCLDQARAAVREAWRVILARGLSGTPHACQVKVTEGRVCLARGDSEEAERLFWEARTEFLRFGMIAAVKETDKLIRKAVLSHRIPEWDDSAAAYQRYLDAFPDSLHNTLGRELVRRLVDDLQTLEPEARSVLDLYCGSGFISRELLRQECRDVRLVGVDGSSRMIELGRSWARDAHVDPAPCFALVPEECTQAEGTHFSRAVCHMGAFQNDLRARHLLFGQVLPHMSETSRVWLTVYAADFRFPTDFEAVYPEINEVNPFKERLFAELEKVGFKPGTLDSGIAPVFVKEDWENLAHFFDFYGFKVVPEGQGMPDPLPIRRYWPDRVAFTRLPIISKKVFGRHVSGLYWARLAKPLDYYDMTYGAVIRADRVRTVDRTPMVFSHPDLDFTGGGPIRYAVAAVLRDRDGKVLFVRRGDAARDYQGAWSLCSTFADPGATMVDCLLESLQRNLGILPDQVSGLAPRSIRFSRRTSADGMPWIMAMCLYEGHLHAEPRLLSGKYSELSKASGGEFIGQLGVEPLGDCVKSYRDLLRCGIVE